MIYTPKVPDNLCENAFKCPLLISVHKKEIKSDVSQMSEEKFWVGRKKTKGDQTFTCGGGH